MCDIKPSSALAPDTRWDAALRLLEQTGACCMAVRPDRPGFPLLFVSRALLELLGHARESLFAAAGGALLGCVLPEDRERVSQALLSGEPNPRVDCRLLRADGRAAWLRGTVRRLTEERDGALLLSWSDVGDLMDRLGELERHDREHLNMVSLLCCGICRTTVTPPFTILYANDYTYEMFGYTRRSAREAGIFSAREIILPEDYERAARFIVENHERGQNRFDYETRALRSTGEIMWIQVRCVLDPVSEVGTVVMLDMTERLRNEERLRLSEETSRVALRHTGSLVMRYDIATRTLVLPQEAADHFGLPTVCPDAPHNPLLLRTVSEDSIGDFIAFYDAILRGEPQGQSTVQRYNNAGEARWYSADFTAIADSTGVSQCAVISFVDITERREKEIAYEKWRQTYESQLSSCIGYYECNLTRNSFENIEGPLAARLPLAFRTSLSAVAEYTAQHLIHQEDRERYLSVLSRSALLERYFSGERSVHFDYRQLGAEGPSRWTRSNIQIIPDPYSNDLKCFVLVQDIDEEKREQLMLKERSQKDLLTGLLNRTTVIDRVEELFDQFSYSNHALVMVDIDRFKQLNDRLGHAFGDRVLTEVANILRAETRPDDVVGRLGGDEFVVCLKNIPPNYRLNRKVSSLCAALSRDFGDAAVTASLGVSLFPGDGLSFESLYLKADLALYEAKRQGRNRYARYQSDAPECGQTDPAPEAAVPALRPPVPVAPDDYSGERYRVIVEQTGTIVLDWSAAADRYYLAPGAARFLFGTRARPPGDGIFFLPEDVHPKDWPQVLDARTAVGRVELTVRLRKTDGSYLWCRVARTRICDEHGDTAHLIVTINDIDAETKARQALEYRAEHDILTGYPNFSRFQLVATRLLRQRGDHGYALWYCDLRNFKFINDIYGYDMGDRLLRFCAKIINDTLREAETFARVSSDHFIILCRYNHRDELQRYFDSAVEHLTGFNGLMGHNFPLELVAGVYCVESDDDMLSLDDMLDRANLAQKSVKALHGSRMALYSADMREQILREKEIESRMDDALREGEFSVYLQPIIDIQRGGIASAEALVRWNRPGHGLLPPDSFIPLFEKNGFIISLDRYVFETVCRYLKGRRERGEPPVSISVNVSRISVFQNDFAERYIDIKRRYGIPDGQLDLECTETTAAVNFESLNHIMSKMRSAGFCFALDDFGSGYSSLNLLKDIVADVLKLDMLFVQNDLKLERNREIIASMVRMAKMLGMLLVAEGVETPEQLAVLRELGCDRVQGYLFSRPIPIPEFDTLYGTFAAL